MEMPELFFCNACKVTMEPDHEVGYEPGQNPTAYEDYFICTTCGSDDTQNVIEKEYEAQS